MQSTKFPYKRNSKNLQFFVKHDREHCANCCILHVQKNVKILQEPLKNPKHPTLWALKHVTSQQSCPNDSFLVRPALYNFNSIFNIYFYFQVSRHRHSIPVLQISSSDSTRSIWKRKLNKKEYAKIL